MVFLLSVVLVETCGSIQYESKSLL